MNDRGPESPARPDQPDASGWYPDPEEPPPAPRSGGAPRRGGAPIATIDIGEVLGLSFKIFFQSSVKLFPLGFLIFTPYFLIEILSPGWLNPDPMLAETDLNLFFAATATSTFLTIALSQILTGAVCFEALERTRGRTATVGRLLSIGIERFLPIFAMSFVMGILMLFGVLLFIVPAIIMSVMFYAAVPVCVVERPGPVRSLGRSRELTKGNRWQVFAIMIIAGLIQGAVGMPFGMIHGFVSDPQVKQIAALGMGAVAALGAVFAGVMTTVVYSQLRLKKEGATSEELLEVFS